MPFCGIVEPYFSTFFLKFILQENVMEPVRMSAEVDRYIQRPGDFVDDLNNQVQVWKSHVVRPLGTAFEASESNFNRVREIAQARHTAQQQRLAQIQAAIGIAMSIVFMATDVVGAAAASRAINVQRRFTSRRGLDTFLSSNQTLGPALRDYLSQSDTFSDALLGNIDSQLRGLTSTSSIRGGVTTVRSLTASVSTTINSLAANCDAAFEGALGFQNSLTEFYESAQNAIYITYVNEVRGGNGDAAHKRAVLERLVDTPLCRPPSLSLAIGSLHMKTYFEISRYCNLVAQVAASGSRGFGLLNDMGGYLADTINQRLLQLTRHYFDNRSGGRLVSEHIRYRPEGDFPLAWSNQQSGLRDFQVVWDGYCSPGQSRYCKTIMNSARVSCIDPYLDTIGSQTAQFFRQSLAAAEAH